MTLLEARALLDVGPFDTADQVSVAYRRRVYIVHPDRNPGDPLAEAKVIRLNEAYAVARRGAGLLDPLFSPDEIDDLLAGLVRVAGSNHDRTEWKMVGLALAFGLGLADHLRRRR